MIIFLNSIFLKIITNWVHIVGIVHRFLFSYAPTTSLFQNPLSKNLEVKNWWEN
jgi:hypothetical protein